MSGEEATLTAKQRMFVLEYVKDFNATQAAIRAGYSAKTANEQGSQNLAKLSISHAIKQVIAERAMSADEVLLRTAAIARGSLESFVVNGAINLEHARDAGMLHLLKRFSTSEKYGDEIEIHDPLRALELLGKANGAFANLRDTFLSKLDVDKLTERQLRALAAGEDVFDVLLNP